MAKRKHHEEHEEHVNHEAWVIPYADMLTLLMALFLVMWAVGNIDEEKFEKVAQSFRHEIYGDARVVDPAIDQPAGEGVLQGETIWPLNGLVETIIGENGNVTGQMAVLALQRQQAAAEAEADALEGVRQEVEQRIGEAGLSGSVAFRTEARGLVVTVVTDQVLFAAGSAALQREGLGILGSLGQVLADFGHEITVEGHTDSVPINTPQYPSNWELSTSRATAVARYLIETAGLEPDMVSASGFADTHPLDTNDTAEGRARNRRVEIVILANDAEPIDTSFLDALAGSVAAADTEGGGTNG